MTRPVSAADRPLDPTTIAGAARDSERLVGFARDSLVAFETTLHEGTDAAAAGHASAAVAEAVLAVVAELRALRLTLVAEGRSSRERWGRS